MIFLMFFFVVVRFFLGGGDLGHYLKLRLIKYRSSLILRYLTFILPQLCSIIMC